MTASMAPSTSQTQLPALNLHIVSLGLCLPLQVSPESQAPSGPTHSIGDLGWVCVTVLLL